MLRLLPLAFCVASFVASGQEQDNSIQPLAAKSLLVDIATRGDSAIAVGERGHLFVYHQAWQQRPSITNSLLTKVTLFDNKLAWAVGHDATIIHSDDGGETWQLQMRSAEIEKPLMDMLFFDNKNGIAIGAYGLFYRTADGGQTWNEEFHGELLFDEDIAYLEELKAEDEALYLSERSTLLPHFNRVVQLDDKRLLMVGELGLAAISKDLGQHWQQLDFPYDGSLFNILETKQGLYVMGLRGHLFKSEDDAASWQEIALPVDSTLNGGLVLSDTKVRLVGNAGAVIDVDSEGKAELITRRQGENLVSIAKTPDGKQWMVGTKGFVQLKQE
ncbi:YCF48-related protein [Shewanella sp. AS1]|nr:YCF48-related protein [Shewanella sp. AS1]